MVPTHGMHPSGERQPAFEKKEEKKKKKKNA